jgi:hypothetical protein
MTRERLLGWPGKAKKLTFECPEVMQEEKSLLHYRGPWKVSLTLYCFTESFITKNDDINILCF